MAGTFLGKYDTTAANNTATGTNTVSVAEGMLPSNINNAFRSVMADIRQHYNDAEWIEYGDGAGAYTPAYVSGTSFTIAGVNVTSVYHVGRRLKLVASTPGTIYGTITATAFSTNTTITISWDSGSLSNEAITSVYVGVLSKTNNSIPTAVINTANLIDDAVTVAKMAVNSVDSDQYVDASIDLAHMSANSIDSTQYVDGSIDTAHIANSQITVGKMAANSVDSDQYVDASIDNVHLAADAVTGTKIADDAIDSEHYTDASIDLAHLSADSVDGTKIVDNAINSEHYTDGSIDTAHVADANITLAKLAANSVNSSKIVDGSIVNADVNASAAIDATKIHDGAVSNAEFAYVNGVTSAIQTQIDAKAATTYVDNAVAGLRTRIIAECASTANVVISSALEAGDVIDGVTLVAGDRVLLKNQSTASQNGLYLAVASGAGAASRDPEHDTIAELSGGMVITNQGTANDNKIFLCTTDTDATLGSTSITYTTITPQNVGSVTSITAGTGLSGGAITSAGTIAIDSTVATLTGTQTLTNKTLTSPVFSGTATNFTSTGIDDNATSTAITIDSSENVSLTSILKVDTVQDQDGNNIINENANTITIGASGDTITIPSGATLANSGIITGFESTGIDDNADATAITINSSEQVEFTAGTALLPAITTTGDANTGMWFPAADTIAFSEGGSEVMRIDSSGKVGVGTASPSQALDVVGSIEVSDGIYIGGTAAANKLDDYEEGTWTPSITTAGGTLSVTYAERAGKYTKIGNIVTYEFYIETSVFSGGTGNLTFGGLPFTVQAGRGALGIAAGSRIDLGIESAVIIPSQSSSNFLVRIKNSTGTGTSDNLTTLDASDWSNNNPTLMYGAGYYRTDS